jgi:AraC-like DNA-binding protein
MDYVIETAMLSPETHLAHFARKEEGLNIAPRIIEDFELVYFNEGEGDYLLPDRTIHYSAGDLILTPPFHWHSYRGAGKPMGHYALHFDPAPGYSERYRQDEARWNEPASLRFLDRRNGSSVIIPPCLQGLPDTALESLFRDTVTRHEEFRLDLLASASLRLAATLHQILALVVESCAGASQHGRNRLARAAAIMDSRYAEDLPIPFLAAEAGYAANYFSGEFSRTYGLSPVEYLRERRIFKAQDLLRSGDLPIKDIAAQVGFDDPYYFSKVFSKRVGLSPTGYRVIAKPDRRGS